MQKWIILLKIQGIDCIESQYQHLEKNQSKSVDCSFWL